MTTRTIKVYGHTDTATCAFTFNGIEVFNGTLSNVGSDSELAELFSFDIDSGVSGNVAGELTVSSGSVCVVMLSANYSMETATAYTDDEGTEHEAILASDLVDNYNWMGSASNTACVNRIIAGEAMPAPEDGDLPGAFHNIVSADETFSADWVIDTAITD